MQKQALARQAPWIYFLVAIGFSWLFWIPATGLRGDIFASPWVVLLLLGGIGPAVGGILLTYTTEDRAGRREYWQRCVDFRRIGGKWIALILLAYPLITLLLALAESGHIPLSAAFTALLPQPVRILPFVLSILVFGPLPEELGWRGYALGQLQKRMNAITASLLLGAIWAGWHIPLFFIQGTYQNALGFASPAFWRFMGFGVLISIFFTWIFNNTRSSTLSAILLHFVVNFTGNVVEATPAVDGYRMLVLAVLALIVIAVFGARDLRRGATLRENPLQKQP